MLNFLDLHGCEPKTERLLSWFTSVKDIIENDYILSANTYNPYGSEEEINHREPKEILREIEKGEKEIKSVFIKMKEKP